MDSPELNEVIGTVNKFIFRSEDTGFTVLSLDGTNGHHIVTGVFPAIEVGEYVRFLGSFGVHKKYGRQFQASRKVAHNTLAGIRKYLSSRMIPGIGPKTAERIVDYFGLKTLDVLDFTPARLEEVPSIGKKKLRVIMESWSMQRAFRMIELFLVSNQLSPRLATKIIETYGDQTLDILTKNPYRLASDIRGIGFISADAFAKNLGIPANSEERVAAAITHSLHKAEDQGHCFATLSELTETLVECTNLSAEEINELVPKCLFHLVKRGKVTTMDFQDADGSQTSAIYLSEHYKAERQVRNKLIELLEVPIGVDRLKLKLWLEENEASSTKLSPQQISAVEQAALNRVFVLTGGPGVGKSTTANAIIRLLKGLGKDVALAAPTGRAAQRLSEITGEPAKTIHRLLEWSPQGGFQINEEKPLTAGAIIIDEASMLDLALARSLLRAVGKTTQIIFIGDIDQLPSVGAGNFLDDLIKSGRVPFVKLTEVFRQAALSDIISYSHAINAGEVPVFSNTIESDCRFIEAETTEQAVAIIKKLLSEILPRKRDLNPTQDVQVLTPMKKNSLGTDSLNQELQSLLNPESDGRELVRDHEILRRGDKVIQTSNNYDLGVFNGDIGYIAEAGVNQGKVIVNFSSRLVTYDGEQSRDLRLAYAITVHKSQGSEFPVVIIPMVTQHYVMLQRNLIYTALTRARKLAILVGTQAALRQAVRTQKSRTRRTYLAELLREGRG